MVIHVSLDPVGKSVIILDISLKFGLLILSVTITEQISLRSVAAVTYLQLWFSKKLLGTVGDDRPSCTPHLIDLKKRFA